MIRRGPGWVLAAAVTLAAEGHAAQAAWTMSPVPVDAQRLGPPELSALRVCGQGDARLVRVAGELLVEMSAGHPLPGGDAIASLQRAAGEPHPWARAWAARDGSPDAIASRLAAWLGESGPPALRRCGVASGAAPDGSRLLVVLAVDALADLAPLPTAVRAGQWLRLDATLRAPASGARVMVLGPSGMPHTVPASFDGSRIGAWYAPDRAGEFTIQVIADLDLGPRPVLEARVLADVDDASSASAEQVAPGEESALDAPDEAAALAKMLSAARASSGLRPLTHDATLDDVACHQVALLIKRGELGHSLGQGDPRERVRAAGIEAGHVGENVARALTIARAHRTLWASPSHRANMLSSAFDRFGVAVARGPDGDAWVVETFAGGR